MLTPSNVNVNSFGKLFAMRVDSTVYAQPLYVPGLTMNDGQVHNVLFVATENDSIYAFDADSNGGANANPIWKISLLTADHGAGAGAVAVDWHDTGSPDVAPTVGITGTPAINPATNTMYVVANTKENGVYYSRLHAINIIDGTERPNSPVNVTATVPGNGNGSVGGQVSFDALVENQRTALNYYKGYVYFGYGAHGDVGPWHGWLFAYDATTLKQTEALCLSPNNGGGAGVWAAGAGLPIDEDGPGGSPRMFVVTGNGKPDSPPFNVSRGFGESIIAFDISGGGLNPIGTFESFNFQKLNNEDWDQGSGGILMVPDNNGPNPHMLIQAGKEGRVLVLNRDDLGGPPATGETDNTSSGRALQDLSNVTPQGNGFWSTPAYWNGNVYLWAEKNVPMLFKLSDGQLGTTPASKSTITSQFPDPTFSISSNGTEDGIAWAVRADQFNSNGPAVLYAWNANDLTSTIYESDSNAKRDAAGAANKFSVPVVTNGKVYVAAHGEVDVYGLFNGEPNAAAPVINPDGGTFGASQNVQLSSATASANIYYTLDGSTPTPASTLYTAPIPISTDTTIKAIASAPGFIQSGVSTAIFNFTTQTPQVVASPAGGTYLTAQTVTLSVADPNAGIYYTTDGSTPSSSSTLYTGPINVAVSETLMAIAIDPALENSIVDSEKYVIQNGGASIDFSNGFSSSTGLTLNGSAAASNDTRLQLTSGGLNQAGSVFWSTPINIQAFSTTFAFQLSNAQGNGFTFTIQNVGPTALGENSTGLGYQGIQKSVAIKFNFYKQNSTGIYTNGEPPVSSSVDLTPSGIVLGSGDSIQAQLNYDGTTLTLNLMDLFTNKTFTMSQAINIPQIVGGSSAYVGFTGSTGGLSSSQKILTWMYTTQSVPPTFSPTAGTYADPQTVTLSSATSDAAIYYTTDGSQPSGASTQYSGSIQVGESETIQAIAISKTSGSSNVASAAYVIQTPPPASAFSLDATSISIASAGGKGTAVITITPSGGFTGTVALTCAITSQPANAVDPPTCSVSQPQAITGTQAVSATLTVSTTGAATAALNELKQRPFGVGGSILTALALFCIPIPRRKWQTMIGLLFAAILIASASGCGSSNSTHDPSSTATTSGTYVVTVTGTSGSQVATKAIAVTVQ